jgi:asparagine synthase (glutamine-hydrolysing)
VRAGRRRPQPLDVLRALHAYAPAPVRRAVGIRRSPGTDVPWLTDSARRRLAHLRAHHQVVHPTRFDSFVRWAARRRSVVVQRRQLDRLADSAGAAVVHPFAEPVFLSGYAAGGGRDGFGDRSETMRRLFADDLPEAILTRRGKARFDAAYYNDHSRALASSWDGIGFDPELVRGEALRREWRKPVAPFRTAMLLQSLWLERASRLAA